MLIDRVLTDLRFARSEYERTVFASPPANYEDFKQRLGIWLGINQTIGKIEEAIKAEGSNND